MDEDTPTLKPRRIQNQNVVHRLERRRICLGRPGAHWYRVRCFHQNLFPNFTVVNVEKPPCFLRKFSPDGRCFIAFSSDQTSLEVGEESLLTFFFHISPQNITFCTIFIFLLSKAHSPGWERCSPSNYTVYLRQNVREKLFSNVYVPLLDIWIPRLPSSSGPAQRPRGRDSSNSQWPALPKHSRPPVWALLLLAPCH